MSILKRRAPKILGEKTVTGQTQLQVECAKCGACLTVCPVYLATGRESLSARGKQHLLGLQGADAGNSTTSAAIFSACLLCGACHEVCPRQLDTPGLVSKARQEVGPPHWEKLLTSLVSKTLAAPALLTGITRFARPMHSLFLNKLPRDSGLRLRLAPLDLERLPLSTETPPGDRSTKLPAASSPQAALFTGCLARHLYPEITAATRLLLDAGGQTTTTPADQACCGLATFAAGKRKEAQRLARQNIAAFASDNLPILTTCASCFAHLRSYPDLFAEDAEWQEKASLFAGRVAELSTFLLSILPQDSDLFTTPQQTRRLLYHDPCHLRFRQKIIREPRRLLALLPDTEVIEMPHGAQCCGQGGLFDLSHPEMSVKIRERLHGDFLRIQVDMVVTSCTGCLIQWQRLLAASGSTARVVHPSVLLARALKNMPHP